MTVEKVSLAVLAVLGVVGLAYFIATTLEVLPIKPAARLARGRHRRQWALLGLTLSRTALLRSV